MQLCIYLCVYLPQAIPLPPSLRTEWDLFRPIHPVQEVDVEPAVVTCSVVVPLVPAVPLQTVGQVCRCTGARSDVSGVGSLAAGVPCDQSLTSSVGTQRTRR